MHRRLEGLRDVVVHAWGGGWRLKAAFVGRTTDDALSRHRLVGSSQHRAGLGGVVAASLMMDAKAEERCIVSHGGYHAEAMPALGEVRAWVQPDNDSDHDAVAHLGRVQQGTHHVAWSIAQDLPSVLAVGRRGSLVWPLGCAVLEDAPGGGSADGIALSAPLPDELPSDWLERVVAGRAHSADRVWVAFRCRCVTPKIDAFAGETAICQFCGKEHIVLGEKRP